MSKEVIPGTLIPIASELIPLLRSIDEVRPDPANPRRTISLEPLKAAMLEFGMRDPINLNGNTMMIEAGHQRYYALKELGAEMIPVILNDDDALMATRFNISNNRMPEVTAEWDEDALVQMMKALVNQSDDGLIGLGYTDVELMKLMDRVSGDSELPPIVDDEGEVEKAGTPVESTKTMKLKFTLSQYDRVRGFLDKYDTDFAVALVKIVDQFTAVEAMAGVMKKGRE
jgi:hypothetical protein